ncbi:MAG: hypothetical protein ABWZ85_01875 [Luteibacter sp.]
MELSFDMVRPGLHVHAYCHGAVDEVLPHTSGIVDAVPAYAVRLLGG